MGAGQEAQTDWANYARVARGAFECHLSAKTTRITRYSKSILQISSGQSAVLCISSLRRGSRAGWMIPTGRKGRPSWFTKTNRPRTGWLPGYYPHGVGDLQAQVSGSGCYPNVQEGGGLVTRLCAESGVVHLRLLRLIQGLDTRSWIAYERREEFNGVRLVLSIDAASVKLLEGLKWRPFSGVGQAT